MAYTNFTNCTEEEYLEVIYSQDDKNRIKIWFNNVELEDAGEYCESLNGTNRILPNDGSKRFSLDNFVSKEYTLVLRDLPEETIIADQIQISIGTVVDIEYVVTSDETYLIGKNYYSYSNNNYTLLVAGIDYQIDSAITGTVYETSDIYEDVPIGIFNLQDIPTTDKNKTTLKLRDNRVKFDFDYNALPLIETLGGTATLGDILDDICNIAGVTNNVGSFDGDDIEIAIYDNSIKATTYVSYILEQGGYIPTIDRDGSLIKIDLSDLATYRIPLSIVEKYEIGTPYTIQRVVYESGIIKYESSSDETLDTLYLNSANPYIQEQEQIDNIYTKLNGFSIDSATTGKLLGNPAIDSYDLIEVYDDDEDMPPSGYTKVEYIESTGTQWIATNFTPVEKMTYYFDIEKTGTRQTADQYLIGYYNDDCTYAPLYLGHDTSDGKIGYAYGNSYWLYTDTILPINERHSIKTYLGNDNMIIWLDGEQIGKSTPATPRNFGTPRTINVFAYGYRTSNLVNYGFIGKVYRLYAKDNNDNLLFDYIPCIRDNDSVAGLYDLVNNQFYTNSGTGTFNVGNAIPTYIFKTLANNTYSFTGVHRQTFDTQIGLEERTENVSKNSEQSFRKYAKTSIDNIEGKIVLATGDINDLEGRVSTAEATLDSQGARLDIVSTNIDPTTGDVLELKRTGYELGANGLIIDDEQGYKAVKNTTGDYYYENNVMIGKYTKDGSVQKDLALFGKYYYGIDENLDVENFTKDDAMFVGQLYEDNNGESAFGHFFNGGGI